MKASEDHARALAQRARTLADLSEPETREFGGWLLDTMSRLIMVHSDQVVAMNLRRMAWDAFNYGTLPPGQQYALGCWVETELDELRARNRRAPGRDRRGNWSMPGPAFDSIVAIVEQAGFDWAVARASGGYGAVIAKAPARDLAACLAAEGVSHGATALDALCNAMRQAGVALPAH